MSSGVLRGRPFGGVGILLHNKFSLHVSFVITNERYVIVCVGCCLLVSVYLPSVTDEVDRDVLAQILAEIENTLLLYPNHSLIYAGDFNTSLTTNDYSSDLINKFITENNLTVCSKSKLYDPNECHFTYHHDTLGHFSYIDYFILSCDLDDVVLKFNILVDSLNLSDHNPIRIDLSVSALDKVFVAG